MARRYQRGALRISTVGEERGHGDIAYQAVAVSPADIEHAVVNILRLHEAPTAMLFCATRDNVRRLHASLIERGFAAVALSGEHSQNERNAALQALRDGRARVCVATDVAARGLDLPSLSLVVHVDLPRDAEALQHRSGRTGRAGNKGTAILIVPCLGFGPGGVRLGYGGGFFERTLAALDPRPVTVGVSYTHGFLPMLRSGPTDWPLDAMLTEDGVMFEQT